MKPINMFGELFCRAQLRSLTQSGSSKAASALATADAACGISDVETGLFHSESYECWHKIALQLCPCAPELGAGPSSFRHFAKARTRSYRRPVSVYEFILSFSTAVTRRKRATPPLRPGDSGDSASRCALVRVQGFACTVLPSIHCPFLRVPTLVSLRTDGHIQLSRTCSLPTFLQADTAGRLHRWVSV
jgi:hypothetical protein